MIIEIKGVNAMPMKNPPHPGDFMRTEIIEPAGLSVTAAAAALKVSRPALSSLLNGKADLSGDMALRIEKAFGVKIRSCACSLRTTLRERACARDKSMSAALPSLPALPREAGHGCPASCPTNYA